MKVLSDEDARRKYDSALDEQACIEHNRGLDLCRRRSTM